MQALVVADLESQRQLEDFFLHREHSVRVCDDCGGARVSLAEGEFEFAFLDLASGEDEVLDLCRWIRSRPDGTQPWVLVLLAEESARAMRAAFAAGADDYVLKPLREDVLKLRLAIGQRRLAEQRQAAIRRERGERRYRTLVETMSEGLFQVSDSGVIEFANSRLSEITGFTQNELIGEKADELLVADSVRERLPGQTLLGTGTGSEKYSIPLKTKSGDEIWVNLTAAPLPALDGEHAGSVGLVEDISRQRDAEEGLRHREEYFEQLFRNSPSGIVILDTADRVVDANRAFVDLFQFDVEELAGRPLHGFIVSEAMVEEAEELSELVRRRQSIERESRRRRKDGSEVDVSILAYPIVVGDTTVGVFGLYSDITQRKQTERKLYLEALHDPLTGLPNRTLLVEHLEGDLRRARRRSDYQFALLFLDLDGFKAVNDEFGHAAGDELLRQVSERLQTCLRPGDTIARLGGDEFNVILEDIRGPYDAARVAHRIHDALRSPIELDGRPAEISVSIGIAFSVTGYERVEDMLRDADTAMYRAKSRGGARYEIFDRSLDLSEGEILGLEDDLEAMLAADRLVLSYQPVVSLASGRIVGFEALARWLHPERGLLMPAELIPACVESGLMTQLGRRVLLQACRQLAAWSESYPESDAVRVSVNLCLDELLHAELLEDLDRMLRETGIQPAALSLEVSEDSLHETAADDPKRLWEVHRRGLRWIVDDFGSGRTSLRALHRLPIESVKIDRAIVAAIRPGGADLEILRAAAALGDSLGLGVVAKGVESGDQLAASRRLGIGFVQGFHLSPPLPAGDAEDLIASDRRWQWDAVDG